MNFFFFSHLLTLLEFIESYGDVIKIKASDIHWVFSPRQRKERGNILPICDHEDDIPPHHSHGPILPIFIVDGMSLEQSSFRQGTKGHPISSQYGLGSVKGKENPYDRVGIQSPTYDLKRLNKVSTAW